MNWNTELSKLETACCNNSISWQFPALFSLVPISDLVRRQSGVWTVDQPTIFSFVFKCCLLCRAFCFETWSYSALCLSVFLGISFTIGISAFISNNYRNRTRPTKKIWLRYGSAIHWRRAYYESNRVFGAPHLTCRNFAVRIVSYSECKRLLWRSSNCFYFEITKSTATLSPFVFCWSCCRQRQPSNSKFSLLHFIVGFCGLHFMNHERLAGFYRCFRAPCSSIVSIAANAKFRFWFCIVKIAHWCGFRVIHSNGQRMDKSAMAYWLRFTRIFHATNQKLVKPSTEADCECFVNDYYFIAPPPTRNSNIIDFISFAPMEMVSTIQPPTSYVAFYQAIIRI